MNTVEIIEFATALCLIIALVYFIKDMYQTGRRINHTKKLVADNDESLKQGAETLKKISK